jgi:hypothetical protein
MELLLKREVFTDKSTTGSLFVNNIFECYTMEDKDRGLKQEMPLEEIKRIKKPGETCIPYGRYQIVVTKSDRFSLAAKRDVYLPILLNVPGYLGIRIHTGNTAIHTEGCLLPGKQRLTDKVLFSADAFKQLNDKINTSLKTEEVWITITK